MAGVNPLMQKFIDRQLDEINAFHRDERKAQIREVREAAKMDWEAIEKAISVLSPEDAVVFIEDKARENGRTYLREQYSEDVVDRRTLAKG